MKTIDLYLRTRLPLLSLYLSAVLLILSSPGEIKGQVTASKQVPDCQITWTFAGDGSSSALANYGTGGVASPVLCTKWTLGYFSVGFTGISLVVQSAPAATINTPGSWGNYAGTVATGINPNTSTTGAQTTFNNGTTAIPWIRITLASHSGSGSVVVMLQGWNSGNGGGT